MIYSVIHHPLQDTTFVMFARPALTEGYHFSDQCLQSLYSFPLDQVSTLKRPTNSKVPPSDELNSNEADAPVVSMPTEVQTFLYPNKPFLLPSITF